MIESLKKCCGLAFVIAMALFIAWVLAGCAGKGLEVDYTDGQGKLVSISTDYQVENGFKMERDGEGYKVELGSATTKDAEMGFMVEMMRMMMAVMTGLPPTSQPTLGADSFEGNVPTENPQD